MCLSTIKTSRSLTVSLVATAAIIASNQMAFSQPWAWVLETIDSGAAIGQYSSLVLDGSGWPRISYRDASPNYKLKYAYRDAAGWYVEIADAEEGGEYSSLGLNVFGRPRISYYHRGSDYDLRYAYRDASSWHTETVDSIGTVGMYTSLALDNLGRPRISYYDGTNEDLKYAYRDASGWHTETVDAAGRVGHDTSLALDGSGYPHISYYDFSHGDLRYAYRDAAGWYTEAVDSIGYVGRMTSLALDASGRPRISYCDDTNGALKYAYAMSPVFLTCSLYTRELMLHWTTVSDAESYWLYGANNQACFIPGFTSPYQYRLGVFPAGATTWSSAYGVGDPDTNRTYLVLAVDSAERVLGMSNRVGEHDFQTGAP